MFIVTGGGSGIGRALAHYLAGREKHVLIIGRREMPLQKTAEFSPKIDYLCTDVSTQEGRAQIASRVQSQQVIEGVIHNAGTIEPITSISKITESTWHQTMATNLEAPLFLTQLLKDKLSKGRVLNISSGAAYFPVKGWTAYCVSKAGLSMLTRCWQLECPIINFASVMPGIIDTDMQAFIRHAEHMDPEKIEFFKQLKANNKLLSTETVALFLGWLLLDIDKIEYVSKEWDIYDKTHHSKWLISPHRVPEWE